MGRLNSIRVRAQDISEFFSVRQPWRACLRIRPEPTSCTGSGHSSSRSVQGRAGARGRARNRSRPLAGGQAGVQQSHIQAPWFCDKTSVPEPAAGRPQPVIPSEPARQCAENRRGRHSGMCLSPFRWRYHPLQQAPTYHRSRCCRPHETVCPARLHDSPAGLSILGCVRVDNSKKARASHDPILGLLPQHTPQSCAARG